ncbi:MAG: TonB-dependent receptor [Sphingobium sp.]|nr:TonB-dependent receptor [Sphingobium sp.]
MGNKDRIIASGVGRLVGGSLLALAISIGVGHANTADDSASQEANTPQGDIIVTASRAASSGMQAPTPTTVVGADLINQRQSANVAQILNEIPAFKASTTPAANAVRTQTPGASTADLRGLGAARTLVLVNGVRVPPLAPASNGTGTIPVAPDLNTVPALMVERMEVVTGGASAQWGSDAVAGVVNIILKNKFEGLEARIQGGISGQGDAGQYRIGVLAGTSFGEGGHIVAGADYVKQNEVGDLYTRSWGRKEYGRVANAGYATNGQAANIITENVHASSSPGGLILGPVGFSLRNYEFTSANSVAPFDMGGIRNASMQIGGQGQSLSKGISLAPGVERFNPYVRAEYEFSDAFTLSVEGSYSYSKGNVTVLPSRDSSITIYNDNAYLPQVVKDALGTAPSFTMSRLNYDLGLAMIEIVNKTPRITIGASGDLGGGWSWDGHLGWGRNTYKGSASNNRHKNNFAFATDAVEHNGEIVCRATIAGDAAYNPAAAGCVPINLFGNGTPDQDAIDYVSRTSHFGAKYTQKTAALNLRGEPFSTWAGPVAFAIGAEYRKEEQVVTADAGSAAGIMETSNAAPYSGKFDVKEAYAEVVVPLAADTPFLRKLDVNGAIRVADYSSAGTQTTWKLGGTWEPVSGLRFRATRSRDIRAPAIFELASNGAVAYLPAVVNGVSTGPIAQNATIGNPNLRPERADTFTVGVVVQPAAVPGFTLSVDYYDINLKDAITTVPGSTAGPLCSAGQTYFCSLFTYAGGVPVAYNSGYINAATINPRGLDIAGSYRLPLNRLSDGWNGSLTLSFSGTYIFQYDSNLGNGSRTIDYARDNSAAGIARFRSNTSLTYANGGFSLTGQVLTISSGNIDNTANLNPATSINTNHVPAVAYANLQASVDVMDNFRLFAGINNLFDKDPPPLPSATLFNVTNGVYYDTIGRAFTIGANVKF